MAVDTQGTLVVIDGTGNPQNILTGVDPYNNQTYQFLLRTNGAITSPTNPQPVATAPIVPVSSGVLESYLVLNMGPCGVCGVQINTTTTPGWVMLFDAASPPADGDLTNIPKKWWQVTGGYTLDIRYTTPVSMLVGATLVFSTTGPLIKTASPTALFSGETR